MNEALAFARRQRARHSKSAEYRQRMRDAHQQRMESLAAEYESVFHELYGRHTKVTFKSGWFICSCSRDTFKQRRDSLVERTQWMRAKLRVASMEAVEDS